MRQQDNYLHQLALGQKEPGLVIEHAPLVTAIKELGGAKGFSVPDPLDPSQIRLPLYIGATTPDATSEVPHWHPEQAEAYVLLWGEAELLVKYRWEKDWGRRIVHTGDIVVAQPEVCHLFQWRSSGDDTQALALVFKAPQVAGVGNFPSGKVTCRFCPHFRRDCALPPGFQPGDGTTA
jgi:hypothetical protein